MLKRFTSDGYSWWQLRLWPLKRWVVVSAYRVPYDKAAGVREAERDLEVRFRLYGGLPEPGSTIRIPRSGNPPARSRDEGVTLADAPGKP
jgi:hypothetical protein